MTRTNYYTFFLFFFVALLDILETSNRIYKYFLRPTNKFKGPSMWFSTRIDLLIISFLYRSKKLKPHLLFLMLQSFHTREFRCFQKPRYFCELKAFMSQFLTFSMLSLAVFIPRSSIPNSRNIMIMLAVICCYDSFWIS